MMARGWVTYKSGMFRALLVVDGDMPSEYSQVGTDEAKYIVENRTGVSYLVKDDDEFRRIVGEEPPVDDEGDPETWGEIEQEATPLHSDAHRMIKVRCAECGRVMDAFPDDAENGITCSECLRREAEENRL